MLLAPLPEFADASRLVFVWTDMTKLGYPRAPLSPAELIDLRTRTTHFDGFGAIWANTTALTGAGEPEQLRIGLVTSDFFSVLGATAAIGRTFDQTDETGAPGMLISWGLFERRFGGDPAVVGRRIQANGQPVTVIGVMPKDFHLLLPATGRAGRSAGVADAARRQFLARAAGTAVSARRRPHESWRQRVGRASGDRVRCRANLPRVLGYGVAGRQFTTVGLQADAVREIRPALLALFGGVVLLLIVACVNVTSLLMARSASRVRETSVRRTLGAGAWRLARQCLAEGVVLSTLGAAAGLLVGWAGLKWLLAIRPASLARLGRAEIDTSVLLFTCVAACFWGLLCSLAPLREILRASLLNGFQRDGQRVLGSLDARTRAGLVVVQVALGVVLLVGAGLRCAPSWPFSTSIPAFSRMA